MEKERILIYSTVFLIMGLSNSVIPVLPEIASLGNTSSATFEYTLLFSGYFIGALLTMIPFGFLVDVYDKLKLILLAVLLTFTAGLILIFTNNIYMLILARFVEGFACGAFFPAAYSILSGLRHRIRYIGEFNFLLSAGLAFGVLSSGFLASWSIKGGIILFTIIAAIILYFNLLYVVQTSHKKVRVKRSIPYPDIKMILKNLFNKKYIRTWLITFLLFGITGVMLAFYPEYSKDTLSKPELGIAIALLYAASMLTNIILGRMDVNFRPMITTGIILGTCGVLLSIEFPYIGFTLLGIGSGMGMLGLPVAVSHMPFERGLAMGMFNTYIYAGLAFMPLIIGIFVDLGYQLMFFIASIFIFMTLFIKDGVDSGQKE